MDTFYDCKDCNLQFSAASDFQMHRLVSHKNSKPGHLAFRENSRTSQTRMDNQSTNVYTIDSDQTVTLTPKGYDCGMCQKQFSSLDFLLKHMELHYRFMKLRSSKTQSKSSPLSVGTANQVLKIPRPLLRSSTAGSSLGVGEGNQEIEEVDLTENTDVRETAPVAEGANMGDKTVEEIDLTFDGSSETINGPRTKRTNQTDKISETVIRTKRVRHTTSTRSVENLSEGLTSGDKIIAEIDLTVESPSKVIQTESQKPGVNLGKTIENETIIGGNQRNDEVVDANGRKELIEVQERAGETKRRHENSNKKPNDTKQVRGEPRCGKQRKIENTNLCGKVNEKSTESEKCANKESNQQGNPEVNGSSQQENPEVNGSSQQGKPKVKGSKQQESVTKNQMIDTAQKPEVNENIQQSRKRKQIQNFKKSELNGSDQQTRNVTTILTTSKMNKPAIKDKINHPTEITLKRCTVSQLASGTIDQLMGDATGQEIADLVDKSVNAKIQNHENKKHLNTHSVRGKTTQPTLRSTSNVQTTEDKENKTLPQVTELSFCKLVEQSPAVSNNLDGTTRRIENINGKFDKLTICHNIVKIRHSGVDVSRNVDVNQLTSGIPDLTNCDEEELPTTSKQRTHENPNNAGREHSKARIKYTDNRAVMIERFNEAKAKLNELKIKRLKFIITAKQKTLLDVKGMQENLKVKVQNELRKLEDAERAKSEPLYHGLPRHGFKGTTSSPDTNSNATGIVGNSENTSSTEAKNGKNKKMEVQVNRQKVYKAAGKSDTVGNNKNNSSREAKNGKNKKMKVQTLHQEIHDATGKSDTIERESPKLLHREPKEVPTVSPPKTPETSQCVHCNKSLAANALKKHIATAHNKTEAARRPYACETCGIKFKFTSHLVQHRVVHSDERPFRCENCPKQFKRKDKLKDHSYKCLKKKKI